jgi:hypothetical protein
LLLLPPTLHCPDHTRHIELRLFLMSGIDAPRVFGVLSRFRTATKCRT